jgi:hypothetical protein
MSSRVVSRTRSRALAPRRVITAATAAAAVAAVLVGGSLLPSESASFQPGRPALVGKTTTICTVAPAVDATTTVSAVAIRQDPIREGSLTATLLGADQPAVTITEPGHGEQLSPPKVPVLLEGEGTMATASSGVVFGTATAEDEAGLMAAPCTPPSTEHWFPGIGTTPSHRSELILSNPDDSQAEVDLRFFGRNGIVVVPGSPGVAIEAHASRTVALEPLVDAEGPLTVWVRASEGRVSAVSRELFSNDLAPAGADWQTSSLPPSRVVVIPAVPEGDGTRELTVVNPGPGRAEVSVQVLGLQGAYAPIGAEKITLAPESTASVSLEEGLARESGSIRLVSDQPVTGAVLSTSRRPDGQPDIAVQSAQAPLIRTGVSALATTDGADSDLVFANSADLDTMISFEVVSFAGVTLRRDEVLVTANGTATRRLNSPTPSYLVVRVPDGSAIFAGIVLSQPEGALAGLSTLAVTSPDVASRAPAAVPDPTVGR